MKNHLKQELQERAINYLSDIDFKCKEPYESLQKVYWKVIFFYWIILLLHQRSIDEKILPFTQGKMLEQVMFTYFPIAKDFKK